jgi:tetratricopeptide (TPR) repeat protein
MRKLGLLLSIFLALVFATASRAQLTKTVTTKAGTPEDKAMDEISSTTDPAQKLALIDKFNADLAHGEYAVLGLDLYVSYYSEAKNYPKMAEYAQKILAVDPDNFSAALHLANAQFESGNVAGVIDAGEKISGILTRYKAQSAPADADASWASLHKQYLDDQKDQITYVQNIMYNSLYKVQAPAERAAFAERIVAAFPDGPYAVPSEIMAANSYQQAQDNPKMVAAAEKVLTMDANSTDMLVLLAEYYSSAAEQLDKALAYAKKAVTLLPNAKAPQGISDDQWKNQVTLQTGLAWSAEGQVLISKNDLDGAATSFRTAGPLLKGDVNAYARNLYRLGFTYARQKKVPEATAALNECIGLNTPFKALAQQTLTQMGTTTTTTPKRSGRGGTD